MDTALPNDFPLPLLREELRILPGASTTSGVPSWTIFDPMRHRYFQIDLIALTLLRNWAEGTAGAVRRALESESNAPEASGRLDQLVQFLYTNGLTQNPPKNTTDSYLSQINATRQTWWQWLVHNYLFIRIPLVRPHRFLKRTAWLANPFYSRAWRVFVLVVSVLGLYLASRQWDAFMATFLHFFSLEGAALYGVTLILLKILHELGHAYTATRFGCRIPTMGVAFLVMFPVLYTDTTDAWRLTSRRKRLLIDSAGVITELMIAGLATFLWAFLPDGPWRSAAFIIATTSWVMTLAVNVSPFMRFDGYYFLSDLLGVQNLQPRSFALGRWSLREILFGLDDPPQEAFSSGLRKGLIIYAWSTWIYRFFLFLGIALLVYALFFKVLGILLFVVEVLWFIGLPMIYEMKEWGKMKNRILRSRRTYITLGIVAGLTIAAAIPWTTRVQAPALFAAAQQARLFAPEPARISAILVTEGDEVSAGQILLELTSPELDFALQQTRDRIRLLQARLDRRVADDFDRADSIPLTRELQAQRNRLNGLENQRAELAIKAPMAGKIVSINPALHAERWVSPTEPLALITGTGGHDIVGYLPESEIWRLKAGALGRFTPDDPLRPSLDVVLASIAPAASEVIDVPYLASAYGGPIAVTGTDKKDLEPVTSQFKIISSLTQDNAPSYQAVRGVLTLEGKPDSLLSGIYRQTVRVLIRESGI